jgi:16S rRNA (cytosine1402-N4)-methyltransferase
LATHQPVLINEMLDALRIIPTGTYIDGTFGQGGHTTQLLEKLDSNGRILAFDKDPSAAAYITQHFPKEERLKFYYNPFSQIKEIVEKHNLSQKINGIVLDLGTSATQLDTPKRGFSFLREGPLDMRMNPSQGQSAAYWLSQASVPDMVSVFERYGEERWAKRIAKAIAQKRQIQAIQTTTQLAQIIKEAHPRWPRRIHPATRIFQAIRIYINQEIEELIQCLKQSIEVLAPGGRLAVITFHSLEAREIKQFMRQIIHDSGSQQIMRWIDTGIKPSAAEIANNPRSRSAVLRVIEKIL